MTHKFVVRSALMMFVVTIFVGCLSAQQVELYPNAGFFWPQRVHFGDTTARMRNEGIYGLKGGVFVTPNLQLEGSLGYINHFESRIAPTPLDQSSGIPPRTIYALLYDVNGSWNFGDRQFFGSRFSPYVTGGVGGLTTEVRHASSALIAGQYYKADSTGATVLSTGPIITVHDGAAFFSVNYGGGIKAMNLWGPVGLRADVRGRTFPNFRGRAMTWPEATGGLTFTFGER